MADGVAENQRFGAAVDGRIVQAFYRGGIRARGVFGDVHRRQIVRDRKAHGFFGGATEIVDGPVFHEAANGAGAEEGGGFDGDAYALGNFGDGADVVFVGARGAVWFYAHAMGGDFASEGFGVGGGAGARAGEADVNGVDAERFHQVQDLDFFGDGGVGDGGILQAVAQSFVV